ncbi:MAG: phosphoribosylamine--glycine ligase [Aggregatilineales bacterium]
MENMKVLVVGNGGREHALAWALAWSERVGQIYVAPGNAGTAWQEVAGNVARRAIAASQNVDIAADDVDGIVKFAVENAIDLVVVGPEVPLSMGLVDALALAGIRAFGPTQAAAQIEASKAFSKQFMLDNNIPTAAYKTFTNYESAQHYVETLDHPVVVKADGLAAGKGVILCETQADALTALKEIMLDKAFGGAGSSVVIEEMLTGPELSVLAFCDGKTISLMPATRDHKRALDHDEGLNTGGMGAFTPVPDVTLELLNEIKETVIRPTVDAMAGAGMPYKGVLYAGIMLTPDGSKTLEFNCRFGDPETQVILPLLETDLTEIMLACIDGTLDQIDIKWRDQACATVILASPGYPLSYPKGLPISGIDAVQDALVFHAGTAMQDGQTVTSGGRVLAVSALGTDLDAALNTAYQELRHIHFDGMHYRTDIGRTS